MTDRELIKQMIEIIDYVDIVKCLNPQDLETLRIATQRLMEVTNAEADRTDRAGDN